ncbi:hypothetical protein MVEN_01280700 [Mycena venus]|uniref:Uncharacterized protein n=1 Tax=Mycena venus TaxID=2733690 RepID=A0A8H6Y112_9AGAR|nr:hypothetical protein MVEN_01280700 [Mycena venus]
MLVTCSLTVCFYELNSIAYTLRRGHPVPGHHPHFPINNGVKFNSSTASSLTLQDHSILSICFSVPSSEPEFIRILSSYLPWCFEGFLHGVVLQELRVLMLSAEDVPHRVAEFFRLSDRGDRHNTPGPALHRPAPQLHTTSPLLHIRVP